MASGQVQRTRENCQNSSQLRTIKEGLEDPYLLRLLEMSARFMGNSSKWCRGGRKVARHIIYWVQAKWQCGYCPHIIDD